MERRQFVQKTSATALALSAVALGLPGLSHAQAWNREQRH
jgi:hypothetical protein